MPFFGGGSIAAALDYGNVTGLTVTPSVTGLAISFTGKITLGARYLVEYLPLTDKTEQPNNPFRWKRLTFIPSTQTSYTYKHAWELESYDVRVRTVAPDGTLSSGVTVSATMPQWAPQNQLALYSQDFSQSSVWKVTGSGTAPVTGTAGAGQTVTFSGANTAFNQLLDIDLSAGKTYTFWYDLQGTGTYALTVYDRDLSSGADQTGTYAGTREQICFTRTWGTAGGQKGLFVGPNTYSGTNRAVTLYRVMVSEGTFTATQMAAQYEASQGPGTTWQGPRYWDTTNTSAGNTTWAGYHRSSTATLPVHQISTSNQITLTGRVRGRGDLVKSDWGNAQLDMLGMMGRADHPGVAGRTRGYAFKGDAMARLHILQCYFLQTNGAATQLFQGYGATQNVQVDQNIWDDLDGRYSAGASGYVQGAWGSTQSRPPGAPLGWQGNNMMRVGGLTPQGANPYALLNSSVSRNMLMTRPGFSRLEDAINFTSAPAPSVNDPIRIQQNLLNVRGCIYDFNALNTLAAAGTTTYSTGTIPATFTLTLTNNGTAVAANATSMTLTTPARVSLNSGQVLSFGGASVTVGAGYNPNSTTLPLNGAGAAVAANAVATLARTDSPGAFSGSWIQPSDSSTHDFTTLTKNMQFMEITGNRGIGQGAFCILDGRSLRYTGNRGICALTLPDGVTAYSGPRQAGPQITQYIGDGWRDSNSMIGDYYKTGYTASSLTSAITQNAANSGGNYTGTAASNERYLSLQFAAGYATVDEEWAEIAAWQAEMAAAGIQIGPFA